MGVEARTSLGREEKVFVRTEASFATYVAHAGTDAIEHNSISMPFAQERAERAAKQPDTRSLYQTDLVTRRKSLTWTIEEDLIPSGVAGTSPDSSVLFEAAMGTHDNTPGVSDAYTLLNAQQLNSLQITREISNVQMNCFLGCYVNEMGISWDGSDETKVSFSGGAKDEIATFRTTCTTDGIAAACTLDNVLDAGLFQVNSLVAILDDDGVTVDNNGNAGYAVTGVVGTTVSLDAVPLIHAATSVVYPFTPPETVAGVPVSGIIGTLYLATNALRVISAGLTLDNGTKELNDEFGYDSMSDYLMGPRRITGSISFRMTQDHLRLYAQAKSFTARALSIISGALTAGGTRITAAFPAIEITPFSIDAPENEEVVVDATYTALATAAENELAITFD